MILLLQALFWLGLAVPAVAYVAYPLVATAMAKLQRADPLAADGPWPTVQIAIAAHDEERDIGRVVRSLLAQAYPGPAPEILIGLDGCTDGTREVLDRLAEPRVRYLDLQRAGKAATDNRLVSSATAEVIVTTAAGAEFEPGALTRLVAPFRDQRVGCTSGRFTVRPDGGAASGGEGIYWRLEYGLMAAESRLGILACASGTSMAHRRSLFRAIPEGSDGDVAIAPNVAAQGSRVLFVSDALVYDDGPASLAAVLENRRRMALRALPTTVLFVGRLLATRHVASAASLVAHKLLRWLAPWFLLLWMIGAAGLVVRGDGPYPGLTVLLVAVGLLSMAGTLLAGPRVRGAAASFLLAQLAFVLAGLDIARGRQARTWTRR